MNLVRLDVGEPDFPTPPHVLEAGIRAMRDGATRYSAPEGILPLRGTIATHLRARGHDATAERVLVTSGAKPMVVHAMRALLERDDEVLVPDPGYPGYAAAAMLAGGRPVPYPVVDAAGAFAIDTAAIERCITPRARVLVLNSPHNPTGGIATPAQLDALAALATRHDLHVVSDEVYSAITYPTRPLPGIGTWPGMAERTVTIDSFSKTYAMTGWRLGYALVPTRLVARVRALILNTTTCTPEFVQRAGVAALEGPQDATRAMVAAYHARRDAVVAALDRIPGVATHVPAGAFYVFPRMGHLDDRGSVWAVGQLREAHALACTPGAAYGARGEGHVRLSFAASDRDLEDGVARLARFAALIGGRAGGSASSQRS